MLLHTSLVLIFMELATVQGTVLTPVYTSASPAGPPASSAGGPVSKAGTSLPHLDDSTVRPQHHLPTQGIQKVNKEGKSALIKKTLPYKKQKVTESSPPSPQPLSSFPNHQTAKLQPRQGFDYHIPDRGHLQAHGHFDREVYPGYQDTHYHPDNSPNSAHAHLHPHENVDEPPQSFSARAVRAINSLGSKIRDLGSGILDRRPVHYDSHSGLSEPPHDPRPPAPPLVEQRRRSTGAWSPGHPFQGIPLEGTYLDPARQRDRGENEDRREDRRRFSNERDRRVVSYRGAEDHKPSAGPRYRPIQRDRSRYNTFHRDGYSRLHVEPYSEDERADGKAHFNPYQSRKRDPAHQEGTFEGHSHASGENHGYPEDHEERHVYGDGHIAGDPYNIRPTDEQVERGYAEEEEHDHYYRTQKFPSEEDLGDYADEEDDGGRRKGAAKNGKRRKKVEVVYDDQVTYDDDEYYDEGDDDRRPNPRRHRSSTSKDLYPEYDYVGDFDDEYDEGAAGRSPILEAHGHLKSRSRPSARSEYAEVGDEDYYSNRYRSNKELPLDERRAKYDKHSLHYPFKKSPNKKFTSPRAEYSIENQKDKDYDLNNKFYDKKQIHFRNGYNQKYRQPAGTYSDRLRSDTRGNSFNPQEQRQSRHQNLGHGDFQRRALSLFPSTRIKASESGAQNISLPAQINNTSIIHSEDPQARGSKESRFYLPSSTSLESEPKGRVRVRRHASELSSESTVESDQPAIETTLPLGESNMEYAQNPHNPANFLHVPKFDSSKEEDDARSDKYSKTSGETIRSEFGQAKVGNSSPLKYDVYDELRQPKILKMIDSRPGVRRARSKKRRETFNYKQTRSPLWEQNLNKTKAMIPNLPLDAEGVDLHGRNRFHKEFGNHFPSAKKEQQPYNRHLSSLLSDTSDPSQETAFDSFPAERGEVIDRIGFFDEDPPEYLATDKDVNSREKDEGYESFTSGEEEADDERGFEPFPEISPVQTNQRHHERVRINQSKRQQEQLEDEMNRRRWEEEQRQKEADRKEEERREEEERKTNEPKQKRPLRYRRRRQGGNKRPIHDPKRYHGNTDRDRDTTERGHENEYRQPDEGRRGHSSSASSSPNRRRKDDRRHADDDTSNYPNERRRPLRGPAADDVTDYVIKPLPQRGSEYYAEEDERHDEQRRYPVHEVQEEDDRHAERRPIRNEHYRGHDNKRPAGNAGGHYGQYEDDTGAYNDVRHTHEPAPPEKKRYSGSPYRDEKRPGNDGRYDVYYEQHGDRKYDHEGVLGETERGEDVRDTERGEDVRDTERGEDVRDTQRIEDVRDTQRGEDVRDAERGEDERDTERPRYYPSQRPEESPDYNEDYYDEEAAYPPGSEDEVLQSSTGRRQLYPEPQERPSYYREPDSRYPSEEEDSGDGGYYTERHPDRVKHDRYQQLQDEGGTSGNYYSDNERTETQNEDSRKDPSEEEEAIYDPTSGYYDGGPPGYYGDDGPEFTKHDPTRPGHQYSRRGGYLGDGGGGRLPGDVYSTAPYDGHGHTRGSGSRPEVTSLSDVTPPPVDRRAADAAVSDFINQMFEKLDPFQDRE